MTRTGCTQAAPEPAGPARAGCIAPGRAGAGGPAARVRHWLWAACITLAAPWVQAIELSPVLTGLSSPVLATHAGDGSGRLFVVEQTGRVLVLRPGATSPGVFLDVSTRIAPGGERGLLGLAFHPQYATNGRLFVFYTRSGDGALTIAEYRASADPDLAEPTELPLLTIPHPGQSNHNGGMLAFGPDGMLYIGTGDGGGSNDPQNNAQNIEVLLGKILRLDVDQPDLVGGTRYSSPTDNPYVGRAGRDEIHSTGWRNPWRFSFDRLTGQGWVADVGQGEREEIDSPLLLGGNYGWRVYEGTRCTGLDSALCIPANFVAPLLEYTHVSGRCSVTGGYVYRGSRNALPAGTYVFADFCTGEVFGWNGVTQSLLLASGQNVSGFGEDESGELYVVGLGGTVSRIVPPADCTLSLSPRRASFGAAGGSGSVTVTAPPGCVWTASSDKPWLTLAGGTGGIGTGVQDYVVAPYGGRLPRRSATLTVGGQAFRVTQSR